MNNFLDQFAKTPLVAKVVMLAVFLGIMFFVNQSFWINPMKEDLARKKRQAADLKVKLLENQAVAANLPKFQEEVNILNEQLKQALALLPNSANVHALFRQLSIIAKKANIDLLSFKPNGVGRKGFYNDLKMNITYKGTYHDIASFIDLTGKMSRIVNVSDLIFASINAKGKNSILTVQSKVTTFMFSGRRR